MPRRPSFFHYAGTFPVKSESRSFVCINDRAMRRTRNARWLHWCTRRSCSRASRAIVRRVFTCTRHSSPPPPLPSVNSRGLPLQARRLPSPASPASRLSQSFFRRCASLYFATQWRHTPLTHTAIRILYMPKLFLPAPATCFTAGDDDGRRRRCDDVSWKWPTACVQTRHTYTRRLIDRR